MVNYLTEAFKRLDLLEDDFQIDTNASLDNFKKMIEDDIDMPAEEAIIDPEAGTADDLQDSYEGKVILECDCCHTRIYKNEEDIIIDEETGKANVEEACPVCDGLCGYNIIGKIEPFNKDADFSSEKETVELDSEGNVISDEVEDIEVKEALEAVLKGEEISEDIEPAEEKVEETLTEGCNEECEDDICPECGHNPCTCKKEEKVEENCDESLNEAWTDAYKEFEKLVDINDPDSVQGKVDALYAKHKGEEDWDKAYDRWCEHDPEDYNESLTEAVNDVAVKTPEGNVEVGKEGNKVTVEFKDEAPVEEIPANEGEMIAPLNDEEIADIEDNVNPDAEVEDDLGLDPVGPDAEIPAKEENEDEVDFDDFDEESFDDLGESFMKKVYENVNSFKTTKVSEKDDKMFVEGLIKFNSGKEKETTFVFENARLTKRGKVILEGKNETFTNYQKAFSLKGVVKDNKLVCESMIYNFGTKQMNESNESEVIKVYGRVVRK